MVHGQRCGAWGLSLLPLWSISPYALLPFLGGVLTNAAPLLIYMGLEKFIGRGIGRGTVWTFSGALVLFFLFASFIQPSMELRVMGTCLVIVLFMSLSAVTLRRNMQQGCWLSQSINSLIATVAAVSATGVLIVVATGVEMGESWTTLVATYGAALAQGGVAAWGMGLVLMLAERALFRQQDAIRKLSSEVERRRSIQDELSQKQDALVAYQNRLHKELGAAQKMQEGLMPSLDHVESLNQAFECQLQSSYIPASEVGGDIWGGRKISDTELGLFIADISGHGVSAAANTFTLNALMRELGAIHDKPSELLEELNNRLIELLPRGQFITMVALKYNMQAEKLVVASAGAPSPILGKTGVSELSVINGRGMPLGFRSKTKYTNQEFDFPRGSFVFLYSDILIEDLSDKDEPMGINGVISLVSDKNCIRNETPFEGVLKSFLTKATMPLSDDLTVVCLSRPW